MNAEEYKNNNPEKSYSETRKENKGIFKEIVSFFGN